MALALIATGHTGGLGAVGATIWIVARILYLPIYVMGVIYVRTALWGVAVIGVLMMLVRLAWSVARPSRMRERSRSCCGSQAVGGKGGC